MSVSLVSLFRFYVVKWPCVYRCRFFVVIWFSNFCKAGSCIREFKFIELYISRHKDGFILEV